MAMPACEKSIDQSQASILDTNSQISTREGTECSQVCPIDCCCCGIEMVGFTMFDLELCGLCEGDYLCGPHSADPPCSTVSGIGRDLTFIYPGSARHIFCVEPGASIRIFNPSSTLTVSFRFTCEIFLTPPPYMNITLKPHEEKFFYNDGSCMVEGCP